MSVLRNKVLTVLLLALWLAATQHCGLEAAADFFAAHDEAAAGGGCCAKDAAGCAEDGCATIEDALYKSTGGSAKVPAPQFAADLFHSAPDLRALVATEVRFEPSRLVCERPLDWLPTWQFVQRTALSPRAPSLV